MLASTYTIDEKWFAVFRVAYVGFQSCCNHDIVEGIVAACYWKSTAVMTEEKRKVTIR
jgi:hypothetical protein